MSVKPQDIAAARALRDEARAIVTGHVTAIRNDLSAQTIGERVKHKATEQAVEVLDETRAVIADNKVVIGATAVTLAGWFARKPLAGLFHRLAPRIKPERLWPWSVE